MKKNINISNINVQIPLHSLVVMVGPSGAGKSTVSSALFNKYEIVSSDSIREELTGDLTSQHYNSLVFSEFHRRIDLKLSIGERVVVDATNLRKKDRMTVAHIGAKHHVPVFYLVINRPIDEKIKTGGWRVSDSHNGVIEKHEEIFTSQLPDILNGDGMATVIDLRDQKIPYNNIEVIQKMDMKNIKYDLIARGFRGIRMVGDIHGMARDFQETVTDANDKSLFILSLGDIVDYGPDSAQCIDIMYKLTMHGLGIMIIGNHERKFEKYIIQKRDGNIKIQVRGGLQATVDQLESFDAQKRKTIENRFMYIMNHARHHIVIDNKHLCAHASATAEMWKLSQQRLSGLHENRAVFGEIDKDSPTNDDGYPNRVYNWVDDIPFGNTVYVGHAILSRDEIIIKHGKLGGKAMFLDTGSGKDGKLSYHDIMF